MNYKKKTKQQSKQAILYKRNVTMQSLVPDISMRNPNTFRKIFCAGLLILVLVTSQNTLAQSSSVDSAKALNPYWSTLRSLILPGWGQVVQERLPQAAFFYVACGHFYYQAAFHYYHYQKGHAAHHYNSFKWNLTAGLFIHALNVLDAADAAFHEKPTGWHGGLFSDKPLKSPWGAALRSAMIPGWGQLYTASYWKAAGFLAANAYLLFKVKQADNRYHQTRNTKYRDERSKYIWYWGAAYFLTVADAYADAYLYKFDQAMRLTIVPWAGPNFWGMNFNVRF